jgi:proteasome lid subunit RPN8/RPN11
MFSKVKVKKNALNYFRKLARDAFPLEIQAYLIGYVVNIDTIEVTDFIYTKEYAMQTIGTVCWYQDDLDKVRSRAIAEDKVVVGDIHTHPSWDAVMSPSDYSSCLIQGVAIAGIVSVYGNKTRVRFWTPHSALPVKIIYT